MLNNSSKTIQPARNLKGTIRLPGDKSISHRYAMLGAIAEGDTKICESIRTRDHGEVALRAFGAEVKRNGNQVSISGGQKLRAIEAVIPGDISSSAFFLCAAALFPGSQLTITHLLMNPTRARLFDVLISMGLSINLTQVEEHHGELVCTAQITGKSLKGASLTAA